MRINNTFFIQNCTTSPIKRKENSAKNPLPRLITTNSSLPRRIPFLFHQRWRTTPIVASFFKRKSGYRSLLSRAGRFAGFGCVEGENVIWVSKMRYGQSAPSPRAEPLCRGFRFMSLRTCATRWRGGVLYIKAGDAEGNSKDTIGRSCFEQRPRRGHRDDARRFHTDAASKSAFIVRYSPSLPFLPHFVSILPSLHEILCFGFFREIESYSFFFFFFLEESSSRFYTFESTFHGGRHFSER